MQSIGFYGAAETVTGSRHLLTVNGKTILVDCGLFQGDKETRDLNWVPFPMDPKDLDLVLITHAHMDHIGWLPRLVAQGYKGPIYSTRATMEIAKVSLPDSGRLQEEDARYHNKKGLGSHKPALPLYTEQMAYDCLKLFEPHPYETMIPVPGGATFRFRFAGHIMGSAFIEFYFDNGQRILFTGDLGRCDTPIIKDPTIVDGAEYLVIESTYGDRIHDHVDPTIKLQEVMNDVANKGSALIVPSFAVGRTQDLLYYVKKLQDAGKAPMMPIFVDSPMATSISEIYERNVEEHDQETELADKQKINLMEPDGLTYTRDRDDSIKINDMKGPMMIISGSGMANGGRVVHHLLHRLSDPDNVVLFTGYQATGTLGRQLMDGSQMVNVLGQHVKVQAKIDSLLSLSAHADQAEMIAWMKNFKTPPKNTFIVHGEPPAQAAMMAKIKEVLGWNVTIPVRGQSFDL